MCLLIPLIFALVSASQPQDSRIEIEQTPASVQRILFDRNHLPADMPPLAPNEAALTQFSFECDTSLQYEITDQHRSPRGWQVRVRLRSIKLQLKLSDRIFLPFHAPVKLIAHEEGHRAMNEKVYGSADTIARGAAAKVLDRDWPGEGDSIDAAGKAATDAAIKHLTDVYLAGTAERASRLGDRYDTITNHGRNAVLVPEAMKLAFQAEDAATQPATMPAQ